MPTRRASSTLWIVVLAAACARAPGGEPARAAALAAAGAPPAPAAQARAQVSPLGNDRYDVMLPPRTGAILELKDVKAGFFASVLKGDGCTSLELLVQDSAGNCLGKGEPADGLVVLMQEVAQAGTLDVCVRNATDSPRACQLSTGRPP